MRLLVSDQLSATLLEVRLGLGAMGHRGRRRARCDEDDCVGLWSSLQRRSASGRLVGSQAEDAVVR